MPSALDVELQRARELHGNGQLAEAERMYRAITQANPRNFDSAHLLGVVLLQHGRYEAAERQLGAAIGINPNIAATHNNRANALKNLGRLEEALLSYQRAMDIHPQYPEAYNNRGNALKDMRRYEEALASYDKAIALRPDYAEAFNNRGNVLRRLGRHEEALASYDKAILIRPDYAEAHSYRGNALQNMERFDEALASHDKAIALKPANPEAHSNRSAVLHELMRYEEALESIDKAIALRPKNVEALNNRAIALCSLKRYDEALAAYEDLIALKPDHAEAFHRRGITLQNLERYDEAIASIEKSVALKPFAEAYFSLGRVLENLKRFSDAIEAYGKAIVAKPDHVDALLFRAALLCARSRYPEAIAHCERVIAIDPKRQWAWRTWFDGRIHACDWRDLEGQKNKVRDALAAGLCAINPLHHRVLSDSDEESLLCGRLWAREAVPPSVQPLPGRERSRYNKIRLAYVSMDFRSHPVGRLMAEIFEHHDKDRFETIAISFGPNDGSQMRSRIAAAFDRFIDVREKSDAEAAALIQEIGVDIAVDLNGLTGMDHRYILASRPAPIQVNYLGYPGSMGMDHIDYIIADRFVIPEDHRRYYQEKVVYLPDTYQANSARQLADKAFTRIQAGLPESGFVFCCFNNTYKIMPDVFDVWMRLLRNVEGSVLWLMDDGPIVVENLRREAEARGIPRQRLVFAPRVAPAEHFTRQRLADLFLDTLPYNAHTTASDALWVGLPLVTCAGRSFPSRVAASILNAMGLPELVTETLPAYEALALKLARDPKSLATVKKKITRNRETSPLFDAKRFTRNLEAAFVTMWRRHENGELPDSFAVAADRAA